MSYTRGDGPTAVASPFVGREADLAQLAAALDEAATFGRGVLAAVGGEPGIGKTRLVQEFVARAEADGVETQWASCWEGTPALWPWAQLVRRLGGDSAAATLDHLAGFGLRPELGPAEAEAARLRFFEAVADLLEQTAGSPRLLVLDDVHWADPLSLRLLSFLAGTLGAPVLIVATYRDDEVGDGLAQTLGSLPSMARRLTLTGLNPAETAMLVGTMTTTEELGPGASEKLAHQTEGNPLFVREIVQLLRAQDRFGTAELRALPTTVRSVIDRRIARLSAQCHDLLISASVIGPEFGLEVLTRACAHEPGEVLALLDEATATRLVTPVEDAVGRYAFSHALIRQALYEDLGLERRAERHRQVGNALEAMAAQGTAVDPAELAYHFVEAAPGGDVDKAVVLARQAGEDALRHLAYEQAARHYEDAVRVLSLGGGDEASRAELLLRVGDADVRAGDLDGARAAFESAADVARARGDGESLALAALGFGTGMGGIEIALSDQAQIDLLEEALAALGDDDSVLRAWVTARLSVALTHVDEGRRRELAEAAVAMGRRLQDRRALAYALATHCDVIAGPEHTDRRVTQSSEVVELARAAGDRELELLGRRLRLVAVLERGDVATADAEIDAFERIAGALRQPLYQWYVPLWRGMRALMQGDFERWERLLGAVATIGEEVSSDNAQMMAFTQRMAFTVLQDGDFTDVAREIDDLIEAYPDLLSYVSVLAEMYARTGREGQARAILDSLRASEVRGIPRDSEWLSSLFCATDATVLLRDRDLAEILYEQLRPFPGRVIVDGIGGACLGAVDSCLARLAALLGRDDDARRHFDDALTIHQAMGARMLVEATQRHRAADLPRYEPGHGSEAVFRRAGGIWTLAYGAKTVQLKNAKGLRDLATLLGATGRAVHVAELLGATEGRPAPAAVGADAVLDRRAVEDYRRRLRDLEEEIGEADQRHDPERASRARAERDAILGELESALGLGGRSRRLGDETERARKAVRARIRLTLDRIEQEHPALARHLRSSVRTGAFCSYEPERPVNWQM